jgi:hypothetical protein
MKKLFIAAMMVLSTSAAFAADSDALKAILKAKNFAEAQSLIASSALANDAEKAAAYNKLVDLAYEAFDEQRSNLQDNEMAKSMGQAPSKTVDDALMYNSLQQAVEAALESYKYDQMPNEKGKVKPRFAKKNAERLYPARPFLINGGGFFQSQDADKAYKMLATYVETADCPLFASVKQEDKDLPNAAFFASYMALNKKDFAAAEKYAAYAIGDKERGADAQKIQLAAMQSQLKSKADTVAYVQKLENMIAKDPNNEAIFGALSSLYINMGQGDKADKMINDRLAANPNDYTALIQKGSIETERKNYDAAAAALEKALPLAPDDNMRVTLNAAIGQCYFDKAQDRVNNFKGVLSPQAREQFNVVYNKAIQYLEAAKKLDVLKEQKRMWAYQLYGAYYFVKGAEAPETQAAAAEAGVQQ